MLKHDLWSLFILDETNAMFILRIRLFRPIVHVHANGLVHVRTHLNKGFEKLVNSFHKESFMRGIRGRSKDKDKFIQTGCVGVSLLVPHAHKSFVTI